MADPRIVNLRDFRIRALGGWPRRATWSYRLPDDVARIDRRTPWGNPFPIRGTVAREAAIGLYRTWLTHRLALDPLFLEPLRGKRLACWCAPLPCHGQAILEALDRSEAPRGR